VRHGGPNTAKSRLLHRPAAYHVPLSRAWAEFSARKTHTQHAPLAGKCRTAGKAILYQGHVGERFRASLAVERRIEETVGRALHRLMSNVKPNAALIRRVNARHCDSLVGGNGA
jgi:hypothetical protein